MYHATTGRVHGTPLEGEDKSVTPLRHPFQKQRLHAAGAAADAHHARAGFAAVAHFGDLDAGTNKSRPRRIDVANAPAQAPEFVTGRISARDRPAHHLDNEVAAAEEHQMPPILMGAVERHVEPEPRPIERSGTLGILGGDHDMVEPDDRRRGSRLRARALAVELEKEHPHTAGEIGGRAGALPVQRCAGHRVPAFELGYRLGLQRHALEPALHLADIGRGEADAGEPLAALADHVADAVGRKAEPARRHQFQRHVGKREQHAIGTIAAALPGGRGAEQRLIGGQALANILRENDDVVEPCDHAYLTISTPRLPL
jgi:hypothetical protein